jgi:hypothetical protein
MATPKTMLAVVLRINGAILINWLTPREKFNSHYFCEKILEPLSEILHGGRAAESPRPMGYFDNATPRRPTAADIAFQLCRFRHAPQPPCHPDISPSDFCLFDDLKRKFKGEEFDTMEELQTRVDELLDQLTPEIMQRAL